MKGKGLRESKEVLARRITERQGKPARPEKREKKRAVGRIDWATNVEQRYLEELLEKKRSVASGDRWRDLAQRILGSLHEKQRAFVEDTARRKAALCTRRAGKSHGAAAALIVNALLQAGSTNVYVINVRKQGKVGQWATLKRLLRLHQVPTVRVNDTELEIELPNESRILVMSCPDFGSAENFRGLRYDLVIIDEAASFLPSLLLYLMEESIGPGLMDADGTLCLIGTPAAHCSGPFYVATTGEKAKSDLRGLKSKHAEELGLGDGDDDGEDVVHEEAPWSVHRWSFADNPHLKIDPKEFLARKIAQNKWTKDNPILRREYRGEWVRSTESLVYAYDPERNDYDERPAWDWLYVLGVDFGYTDHFACTVWAFVPDEADIYEVETFKRSKLLPSQQIEAVKGMWARYGDGVAKIVGDSANPGALEEMRLLHGIPIEGVKKANNYKAQLIELFNGELIDGHVHVASESLREEWSCLKKDALGREDPRFQNHAADASLYAYWGIRQMSTRVRIEPPRPDEWDEGRRIEERLVRQMTSAHEEEDSPWGDRW